MSFLLRRCVREKERYVGNFAFVIHLYDHVVLSLDKRLDVDQLWTSRRAPHQVYVDAMSTAVLSGTFSSPKNYVHYGDGIVYITANIF